MERRLARSVLALGRLQDAWLRQGRDAAEQAGATWESWIRDLFTGGAVDDSAAEARARVSEVANELARLKLLTTPEALWDYCIAGVLRRIRVEPSRLSYRWHALGRADELPAEGDYLTARVVQEPVVVVRRGDGTPGCFLNVCPHRSAEMLTGRGRLERGRITCPYHGWCFDARGACINVPGKHRGEFGTDFSPAEWGLRELSCRQEEGWLYTALDGWPPSEPNRPSPDSLPAARRIAELLHRVRPGFPDVQAPEVADTVRFHLRLGRVAARLERLLAEQETGARPEGEAARTRGYELQSLGIELRQALFDTQQDISPYRPLLTKLRALRTDPGIGSRRPPAADGETSGPVTALPFSIYGAPSVFAAETAASVRSTWQFVGHANELREPGRGLSLCIAGERVHVFRRADGRLAAGIEGWLGDASASQGRPAPPGGTDFSSRLEPIDLDVWNGLLFVRLEGDGPPVAEVWENPGLLEPYRIAAMEPLRGPGWYDADIEVDTKVLWENFLELYHFPIAHPSLSRLFRTVPDSDFMPIRRRPSPSCTPAEREYFESLHASAPHSLEREIELRGQAEDEKRLDAPFHFTLFGSIPLLRHAPITLGLTVFPDHLQAMAFLPIGPRECRIRIRSYGHPIDTRSEAGIALARARCVNVEDLQIELVEEDILVNYLSEGGTGSRLERRPGILGVTEVSVRDYQEVLRRALPDELLAR